LCSCSCWCWCSSADTRVAAAPIITRPARGVGAGCFVRLLLLLLVLMAWTHRPPLPQPRASIPVHLRLDPRQLPITATAAAATVPLECRSSRRGLSRTTPQSGSQCRPLPVRRCSCFASRPRSLTQLRAPLQFPRRLSLVLERWRAPLIVCHREALATRRLSAARVDHVRLDRRRYREPRCCSCCRLVSLVIRCHRSRDARIARPAAHDACRSLCRTSSKSPSHRSSHEIVSLADSLCAASRARRLRQRL